MLQRRVVRFSLAQTAAVFVHNYQLIQSRTHKKEAPSQSFNNKQVQMCEELMTLNELHTTSTLKIYHLSLLILNMNDLQ